MKTDELIGKRLNWAVGIARGWLTYPTDSMERGQYFHTTPSIAPLGYQHNRVLVCQYRPSTEWAHGGPIIERERLCVYDDGYGWSADSDGSQRQAGPTPLIAAMRCYVASKLGDEVDMQAYDASRLDDDVEIPAELAQEKTI
tara:strand:+ start:64 stop:489 length:426 start_codon:yes stop_codon:yes gene_type:complete